MNDAEWLQCSVAAKIKQLQGDVRQMCMWSQSWDVGTHSALVSRKTLMNKKSFNKQGSGLLRRNEY